MNTLFAILSILAWNEPEVGNRLALTQNITLGSVQFDAGSTLLLQEMEPLPVPGAPLLHYVLTAEKCEHPDSESEIEIITPNGNAEASAVGVQLSRGCTWEVYLEQKDFFTPSFFSLAP